MFVAWERGLAGSKDLSPVYAFTLPKRKWTVKISTQLGISSQAKDIGKINTLGRQLLCLSIAS